MEGRRWRPFCLSGCDGSALSIRSEGDRLAGEPEEAALSPIRTAATVIGVAIAVARHPVVRTAIKAAPLLITPRMREMATDATLETAFRAGVVARKIVHRT